MQCLKTEVVMRTSIRSHRGQSRRADFYVCDTCDAVIHGRAGMMHLGVLAHLRMHKRKGEKPPPKKERDRPEDRELVWKAGRLAIGGIEAVRSLDQARAVLAGKICTPSIAKQLNPEEKERLRALGQLQESESR